MALTVAIVGAGPSGLTLARLLSMRNVNVTIFERDTTATSRPVQGGTLDLHTATGLAALKKCDLWDEALKYLRFEGDELTIADKNDTHLLYKKDIPTVKTKESGGTEDYIRPEIDREKLKQMLLESIDPQYIQWGKVLQSIDPKTGVMTFRDNSTAGPFNLVVGADGAWSKVRAVLTDAKPSYAGVSGFWASISNPNTDYPNLSKLVGSGSYFCYSDEKFLSAQRMSDQSINVATWVKKPESWVKDQMALCGEDEDKLRQILLADYADWMPVHRRFLQVAHDFKPWPLYELPMGEFWDHKKGFTLIGDAASLFTPFAGEGVNKAMRDALELADLITSASNNGTSIDDAVAEYEKYMFPRAKKIQQKTLRNKKNMLSKNGAVGFLVTAVDMIAEEMGLDAKWWWKFVPAKTMMWSYLVTRQWVGKQRRRISRMIWGEK